MALDPALDENDNEPEDDEPENPSIKQIRDAQRRAEKRAEKAEQELAAFRAREKEQQVGEVFSEAGLSPKHARLFQKDNPEGDVTKEAVLAWAAENDLTPQPAEPAEQPPVRTYEPGPPGQPPNSRSKISEDELDKLMQTNPALAVEKANRGEVDWSEEVLQITQ